MLLVDIYSGEVQKDNIDMADGMKHLFDASAPLHLYLYQEQEPTDKSVS